MREGCKHHIEIFPAALLAQRELWQQAAHSLPAGTYLLVTGEQPLQAMRTITQSLRQRGREVIIWMTPAQGKRVPRSVTVDQ